MTNTNSLTTARATLSALADLMWPRGANIDPRKAAIATTLRQIAEIGGDLPLTPGDAEQGYLWVGQEYETDEPPTTARRATCRELADVLAELATGEPVRRLVYGRRGEGNSQNLAAVFEAVAARFENAGDLMAGSNNARLRAIAATAAREAAEIRTLLYRGVEPAPAPPAPAHAPLGDVATTTIKRAHLIPPVDLGTFLRRDDAVGMIVWLEDVEAPIVIGDINAQGGVCDDCHYGHGYRVLAYARVDVSALDFGD